MNMSGQKELVDEITSRLGDMNVDSGLVQFAPSDPKAQFSDTTNLQYRNQTIQTSLVGPSYFAQHQTHQEDTYDFDLDSQQAHVQAENLENARIHVLIVTNLDPVVFTDPLAKSKFESLFSPFGNSSTIEFRYLKSFKRIRIDFKDPHALEMAQASVDHLKFGRTQMRCYKQMINLYSRSPEDVKNSSCQYLRIPKPTKQFLISPPASPPVGWEPVTESSPCIDVQLIAAIANLVPGKVHEIHPASESQPGISVEICEDAHFDLPGPQSCIKTRSIPRTPNPTFHMPSAMDSS